MKIQLKIKFFGKFFHWNDLELQEKHFCEVSSSTFSWVNDNIQLKLLFWKGTDKTWTYIRFK